MSGRRRKSRELALQLLYQHDMAKTEPEEMFRLTEEYVEARPEVQEYASRLVLGTLARLPELDGRLSERSDHWRLGRMPAVDRNLLRMALYELLHEDEIPDPVVIDEAVEIAKKFSTPSSGSFVNGVLDGIRRSLFGPRPALAGPGGAVPAEPPSRALPGGAKDAADGRDAERPARKHALVGEE